MADAIGQATPGNVRRRADRAQREPHERQPGLREPLPEHAEQQERIRRRAEGEEADGEEVATCRATERRLRLYARRRRGDVLPRIADPRQDGHGEHTRNNGEREDRPHRESGPAESTSAMSGPRVEPTLSIMRWKPKASARRPAAPPRPASRPAARRAGPPDAVHGAEEHDVPRRRRKRDERPRERGEPVAGRHDGRARAHPVGGRPDTQRTSAAVASAMPSRTPSTAAPAPSNRRKAGSSG